MNEAGVVIEEIKSSATRRVTTNFTPRKSIFLRSSMCYLACKQSSLEWKKNLFVSFLSHWSDFALFFFSVGHGRLIWMPMDLHFLGSQAKARGR